MATYDYTFTLVGPGLMGNITITWNVRPEQMEIDEGIMVAKHPIPGSNHSITQMLGSESEGFKFDIQFFDIYLVTDSNGPQRTADTLRILRGWARNGNTCTFYNDYIVNVLGEAAGIPVKVTQFGPVTEIPSTDGTTNPSTIKDGNYNVPLELTHYFAGGV